MTASVYPKLAVKLVRRAVVGFGLFTTLAKCTIHKISTTENTRGCTPVYTSLNATVMAEKQKRISVVQSCLQLSTEILP